MRLLSIPSFVPLVLTAFIVVGCSRHKATVSAIDLEEQIPADTSFSDVHDFSSVDTSSAAFFREASLSGDLEREAKEALKPVYFDYDSYVLGEIGLERVMNVVQFLGKNPSLRILIEGHCDQRGTSQYNMGLGENRAKVVRDYLLNYGVQPVRLEITSYGKESLAKPGCGDDEGCHSLNRRSEFRVLSQ